MTTADYLEVGDLVETDWFKLPLEEMVDVEALIGSEEQKGSRHLEVIGLRHAWNNLRSRVLVPNENLPLESEGSCVVS